MKTQLLEDIGQSAALPLPPLKTGGNAVPKQEAAKPPPLKKAAPAEPRSTHGVWRERAATEPVISKTQTPDPQPVSLELESVFEEIAALEAQYVQPAGQSSSAFPTVEPVELNAPVAPRHAPSPYVDELPHAPGVSPAEPTPAPPPPPPMKQAAAPRDSLAEPGLPPAPAPDPLFDFTPPAPEAVEPFTRPPEDPAWFKPRYLLWAVGLLSVAALVQGGRWLYQERHDSGALALVAAQAKGAQPAVQAGAQRASEAKAVTPATPGDAPVPPADSASRPVSAAPPLVMLEPEQAAPGKAVEPPSSEAVDAKPEAAAESRAAAEPAPAAPVRKPPSRTVRKQPAIAAKPAAKKEPARPVRQAARASAIRPEKPAAVDTSMTATLKACREHGYHAAQCVKQGCSVTEYGFVCRGR